jgi:CheY-like chemotaxis protein
METANADEAIRILESRNDIRIVFTNIEMPGSMDGVKLAARVRDRWPPIEIILTSGYLTAEDVALQRAGCSSRSPATPAQSVMRCGTWRAG